MTERPILFCGSMVRAILDGRKTVTRRLPMSKRWLPGDTLWVREAHRFHRVHDASKPARINPKTTLLLAVLYTADGGSVDGWGKARPSIHMPRWASRITLEVVSVSVERLDEVTEAEAQLEGFDSWADFYALWTSLHRDAGDNPWLWRVEFRRVK